MKENDDKSRRSGSISERKQQILDHLNAEREISVKELAGRLFVSESTIRRELVDLVSDEKIIRTHRGAKLKEISPFFKSNYNFRSNLNSIEKDSIAKQSLQYIHDYDVIMMDDSTTAMYLVPYLKRFKDVLVITNCISTASLLCELEIKNLFLGGEVVNYNTYAYVGSHAEKMLSNYYGNVAVFSCKGISMDGDISSGFEKQDLLRVMMMRRCKTSLLLCDSTKIGKKYIHTFASVRDVDMVICDQPLPGSISSQIGIDKRRHNIENQDLYQIRMP